MWWQFFEFAMRLLLMMHHLFDKWLIDFAFLLWNWCFSNWILWLFHFISLVLSSACSWWVHQLFDKMTLRVSECVCVCVCVCVCCEIGDWVFHLEVLLFRLKVIIISFIFCKFLVIWIEYVIALDGCTICLIKTLRGRSFCGNGLEWNGFEF